MRVLLDSCVWGGVAADLRALGHDVECVSEWPEDPGDDEILLHAHRALRILVTLDKDFGELAIVRQMPHSGIVRVANFPARELGAICQDILAAYADELMTGAIVTVEPGRTRVRPGTSGDSA